MNDISLILPTRNEAAHIQACLEGLLASELGGYAVEIIVADGMSEDGTREIVSRIADAHPAVRLVDNPHRTTPQGLNAAIRAARSPLIIRIDAHTRYAPDYVAQCVRVLNETGADNVGGPWVAEGRSYVQRAIAAAFGSPFAGGGGKAHDAGYEGEVDTVYLGCWRREVFDRIGLFDEELVRNQDDELNFRLLRAGGTIWQSPSIRSWYTPRSSLRALFKQYFQYGYWKVRVMQKHGQPASPRHLVPGTFAATLGILVFASTIFPPARLALGILLAVYTLAAFAAATATAAKRRWALMPLLPVVFATYHLSYGFGFLAGVWDFLVRKRKGRFVSLSRG